MKYNRMPQMKYKPKKHTPRKKRRLVQLMLNNMFRHKMTIINETMEEIAKANLLYGEVFVGVDWAKEDGEMTIASGSMVDLYKKVNSGSSRVVPAALMGDLGSRQECPHHKEP